MDKKTLIGEVKVDGFNESVQVYLINDSYYSVEYRGKEEYYTTNKKIAFPVGKMILTYYRNLKQATGIFNQNIPESTKWKRFLDLLKEESKATKVDWDICLSVYRSLEAAYLDMQSDIKDREILSRRTAIRNKDNLIETINKIVRPINEKEADRNIEIYKEVRNKYIKSNPYLGLDLL